MSLLSKALHLHQDNNMDKDLFGILEIKNHNFFCWTNEANCGRDFD